MGQHHRKIRSGLAPEKVLSNVFEYLNSHIDADKALEALLKAGCDQQILFDLAAGHCLANKSNPVRKLIAAFARLQKSLREAEDATSTLMDCLKDLGAGPDLVSRFELDTLLLSLKRHEFVCGHFVQMKMRGPKRIRIDLPLLCIYVEEVTGKQHYPELAALLRTFFNAGGIESKSDVQADAVRKTLDRVKKSSADFKDMKGATRTFLATREVGGQDPAKLLRVLAYLEMGLFRRVRPEK